jgi:hypothetical protein
MIGYPVNTDLLTRLLQCQLGAREHGFVQSLVGRQSCSREQFNWLHAIASRHRRKLQSLRRQGERDAPAARARVTA